MTIRKVLIAMIVLLCQPAFALTDAVETSAGDIILPATVNGTMTFKPCAGECDREHKRARLTPNTKFALNGKAVKFEEFRREFSTIKRSDKSYALVSYDTETNTVTKIDISR